MSTPHLSISQINMFRRCGMQWMFRYVEKKIAPPGIALEKGKAVHAGRRKNLSQKIDTAQDLPAEEVNAAISDGIDNAFRGDLMLSPEEADMGLDKLKGQTKDSAITLGQLDYKTFQVPTDPVLVEKKLTVLPNNFPVELVGIVDLVDDDGMLRDLKTSGRTPPKDTANTSDQLTMYSMLYRATYGMQEQGLALDYVIDLKTPKTAQLTTTRTTEQYERFLNVVGTVWEAMQKGVFLPPEPGSWVCSPRFCGYHAICPMRCS